MTKFILPIALLSLSAGLPSPVLLKETVQKSTPKTMLSATEVQKKWLENQDIIDLLKKHNVIISGSTDTVTALQQQAAAELLQNRMIVKRYPINTNEADAGKYALRLAPVPDGFQSRMPMNEAVKGKESYIIIDKKK